MAAAKKATTSKAGTTKRRTTSGSKRTGSKKKTANSKVRYAKTAQEVSNYQDKMAFETGITIIVLFVLAIFMYLSYFGLFGKAGVVVGGLLFGFFGWVAWCIPAYILIGYMFALANRGDKRVLRKLISAATFLLSFSSLMELISNKEIITEYYTSNHVLHRKYFECLYLSFEDVVRRGKFSGGIVGRGVGVAFSAVIGKWGAAAVLSALILLSAYIFYGLEWMASIRKRNAYHEKMQKAYEEIRKEEDYLEPSYQVIPKSIHRNNRQKVDVNAKRRLQAVDLKRAGKKIDNMEKEAVAAPTNVPASRKAVASNSDIPINKAGSAAHNTSPEMQEIHPDGKGRVVANPKVTTVKKDDVFDLDEIPIYREEMNQKFGTKTETKKPMASFAPKKEVTDVTPTSQKPKQTPTEIPPAAPKVEPARQKNMVDSAPAAAARTAPPKQPVQENAAERKQEYVFPPVDLLAMPAKNTNQVSDDKLRLTASKLQDTLQSFNVDVSMGAVTCGPTVTRYEVLPEQGVRVNKITNLADDLKLSLAAPNIRIEAPIPGKAAVGIEVPNEHPSAVHFRELLQGDAFSSAKSPVAFAVGKDIAGKIVIADIAKMPHLLIAGATGSGKSVCINTLIMSIIYKSNPEDVKMIMIDPKVVELSVYNGIPHLFCPVVTDAKEAAASLNWAVREMMDRYNKFQELGVRNIQGYNKKIKTVENAEAAGYTKMPLLVIIVDEFADLMMVASKEVEDAVCRLAQLARAAGIHLILATQRPSVNVITGVIKANIPSRIAFSVSSSIDSRTILDKGGAEKLLGKGDMLFFPSGYSEPVRLQGAFVSDKEVSDVVDFLRDTNAEPVYNDKVTEIVEVSEDSAADNAHHGEPDRDEYFEDAGRFVIESERAAAGQLQRRFSIGFNRAGRIIDQLHKAGVVGPAVGTKPRAVLMTMEQFNNYLGFDNDDGEPIPEQDFEQVAKEFCDEVPQPVDLQ